jgi:hypothetical protein
MAIASLSLPAPIRRRPLIAPRDYALRDRAIELHDAGRHLEAVQATLAYILPDQDIPPLAQQEFSFVQGSARVRVQLKDQHLTLCTVLAELVPETQATAALRYFLSRLSSTGQLYQPRLHQGRVTLEFGDTLDLLHPTKLLEVLQRMPTDADANDGWISEQFGLRMADRELPMPLDDAEFAQALALWQQHWNQVDELMLESRRRRSVRFLDALGSFAVNHLRYTLPLYGPVRARLNQNAEEFDDDHAAPGKRDAALARCIREMRQVSATHLRECLGHARHAINPLTQGTPAILGSVMGAGESMQTTGKLRATGRSLEAVLPLLADFLYLLSDHSWPEDVEAALRAGLDQASGKPWREALETLWQAAHQIAREFGSHDGATREDEEAGGKPAAEAEYDE